LELAGIVFKSPRIRKTKKIIMSELTGRKLLEILQRRTPEELKRPVRLKINDRRGREVWAMTTDLDTFGVFCNEECIWVAGMLSDTRLLPEIKKNK
jgi:hypothetical protein